MDPLLLVFLRGFAAFFAAYAVTGSAYAAYWVAIAHDSVSLLLLLQ